MANIVLVPGFWLGGWAWADVAAPLRAAGHTVYTPSLTGLGERVHLGGPQTDLETHITDVILVGHSYAGALITGVADRIPERLARLVYVDTAPLPAGMAQADFGPPEQRARRKDHCGAGRRLATAAAIAGRTRPVAAHRGARRGGMATAARTRGPAAVGDGARAEPPQQPRAQRDPRARHPLHLQRGAGARDDRERQPGLRGTRRAAVVLHRTADRALADVLQTRRAGRDSRRGGGGGALTRGR